MIIYICLSVFTVIISAFIFHPHILLFSASAVPFTLFIITIVEICLLRNKLDKSQDEERLNNTAYSLKEIDNHALKNSIKYLVTIKSLSLPFYLIFVFFFVSPKKIICTVLLYLSTYICARLLTEIKRRIENKK